MLISDRVPLCEFTLKGREKCRPRNLIYAIIARMGAQRCFKEKHQTTYKKQVTQRANRYLLVAAGGLERCLLSFLLLLLCLLIVLFSPTIT